MTLHETVIAAKKFGIGSIIGIICIGILVIFIRIGIMIKNTLYPPKKGPTTQIYGVLPKINFPKSVVNTAFTYTLQTESGTLPTDTPDRLSVFPIVHTPANFLNLEKVKNIISALNFKTYDGSPIQEIQLTKPFYEWDETVGINRKIIFNINTYDFKMTSNFLTSLRALEGSGIKNEAAAIQLAQTFLMTAKLLPKDLDLTKTNNPKNPLTYATYPKLYTIETDASGENILRETTSLSKTKVIRVDFYQKDAEYDMNSGYEDDSTAIVKMKVPIYYPNPPYSTMSFWIATGPITAMVTQSFYTHQTYDITKTEGTYNLKGVEEAFNELKAGRGYIAAYNGADTNILIKDIYVAYYLGEETQDYMTPIYVFEGNNGFFAYVSAVDNAQIQQ